MKEENTSTKSNNNVYKIVIALLALLLLGAAYIISNNYSELRANKSAFAIEKQRGLDELKAVQQQYDVLLTEDIAHQSEITSIKERLAKLMDSVKNIKPDYTLINKLRSVRDQLKKQLANLQTENEALKKRNNILTVERDSISGELASQITVYDSVAQVNTQLKDIVDKAQKLVISNPASRGVRIRKNNKVVKESRARKTTGIEVCYDVPNNSFSEAGLKEYYIQVLSPSKKVIGSRFAIGEYENEIKISKVSKFRYSNKFAKICDFVELLPNESFTAGQYIIHIYTKQQQRVASSIVTLK